MPTQVFLCPTLELARAKAAELTAAGTPFATVEAEYGSEVVKGNTEEWTLAHHTGEYRSRPAPCNYTFGVTQLPKDGCVIISHIDLDTVGGVLSLFGSKPQHMTFWAAAEFIDLNGPHRLMQLSETDRSLMRAYWAATQERPAINRTLVTEVSHEISRLYGILQAVLDDRSPLQAEMIQAGREWAEKQDSKVEACLVEEDDFVRLFVTNDTFTSAAYYSPRLGYVVPATVSLNTRSGAITIACEGGQFDACKLVQSLWGPTAGGHPGIAGSPRGERMGLMDLVEASNAVHDILTGDNQEEGQ